MSRRVALGLGIACGVAYFSYAPLALYARHAIPSHVTHPVALPQGCPRTLPDLERLILGLQCTNAEHHQAPMTQLRAAVAEFGEAHFLDALLPFMLEQARGAQDMTQLPLLSPDSEQKQVTLTQHQCLGLLCNGFFCAFPDRTTSSSHSVCEHPEVPSFNFDRLLHNTDTRQWVGNSTTGKLVMLLHYFDEMRQRVQQGDRLANTVSWTRLSAGPLEWTASRQPLARVTVADLGATMDGAKDALRVDFAATFLGGGVLGSGAVQEEIMFAASPELIVGRLLNTVLRANEAVLMMGTEQFSVPKGYSGSLGYGGPYHDTTRVQGGMRQSYIVAVDAVDYSRHPQGKAAQYTPLEVRRELTKAWSGLNVSQVPFPVPMEVATGNWGCGVFGGDVALKSMVQLLACSVSGREMRYFPWWDRRVKAQLPLVAGALHSRQVTVGQLASFLLQDLQPGDVYQQLNDHFCLNLELSPPQLPAGR